jgi:hypothetical protein
MLALNFPLAHARSAGLLAPDNERFLVSSAPDKISWIFLISGSWSPPPAVCRRPFYQFFVVDFGWWKISRMVLVS